MKTVMSTDWIKVHDHDSVYMARVFLTDENEAYMIRKLKNETKFFRVNPELLKLGELVFFERAVESAEELPIEPISKIGLVKRK